MYELNETSTDYYGPGYGIDKELPTITITTGDLEDATEITETVVDTSLIGIPDERGADAETPQEAPMASEGSLREAERIATTAASLGVDISPEQALRAGQIISGEVVVDPDRRGSPVDDDVHSQSEETSALGVDSLTGQEDHERPPIEPSAAAEVTEPAEGTTNLKEVLTARVDSAIAAAPRLSFTSDGSHTLVQLAGAKAFAEHIQSKGPDEIITIGPAPAAPNRVDVPDAAAFEELVGISYERLAETWPEDEQPDPDDLQLLKEDTIAHERAHADKAATAGLDVTYTVTFAIDDETGELGVGPAVVLSGSATKAEWFSVFREPEAPSPLDMMVSGHADSVDEQSVPTKHLPAPIPAEEEPSSTALPYEHLHSAEGQHNNGSEETTQNGDKNPANAPGQLRATLQLLCASLAEAGVDIVPLLTPAQKEALPLLLDPNLTNKAIAAQLGKGLPSISMTSSRIIGRVLEKSPGGPLPADLVAKVFKSPDEENPKVGSEIEGLLQQTGVTVEAISEKLGVSPLTVGRLLKGQTRPYASRVLIPILDELGVSGNHREELLRRYHEERRIARIQQNNT